MIMTLLLTHRTPQVNCFTSTYVRSATFPPLVPFTRTADASRCMYRHAGFYASACESQLHTPYTTVRPAPRLTDSSRLVWKGTYTSPHQNGPNDLISCAIEFKTIMVDVWPCKKYEKKSINIESSTMFVTLAYLQVSIYYFVSSQNKITQLGNKRGALQNNASRSI